MSSPTQSSTQEFPYVDLHSHLQFEDFDVDREGIIAKMQEEGVITINVGTTLETSRLGVELAANYAETCYATVGLHPVYADEGKEEQGLENLIVHDTSGQIVGIGECGMDFFRGIKVEEDKFAESEDKVIQEKVFIDQIQLAIKHNLPLMLHVRDSYQKTLEILSKYFKAGELEYRGNAHFFVGTIEEARAFLNLGFSISFTGVITFVPAYEELVRFVPLERMFAETDSPYVSPVPFRGKRNNPVHVIEVYKKIAEIKNIPLEVVKETLYKNACKYWLKSRHID
ncbi:MAG: TatD family hydrolase [Patescibacteria group bacterium]